MLKHQPSVHILHMHLSEIDFMSHDKAERFETHHNENSIAIVHTITAKFVTLSPYVIKPFIYMPSLWYLILMELW